MLPVKPKLSGELIVTVCISNIVSKECLKSVNHVFRNLFVEKRDILWYHFVYEQYIGYQI